MPESTGSKALAALSVLNAINPWLSLTLKGVAMALEAKRAFLKANPTYVVDISTGEVYQNEAAAKAAGVAAENIKLELPPTAQLIDNMVKTFSALEQEAHANFVRVTSA